MANEDFTEKLRADALGYSGKEQSRIHPIIFEGTNELYYEGKMLSTGDGFDLPTTYEPEVRKLYQKTDDEYLSEKQIRSIYFEIPGANHAKTSTTGSRANMKYLLKGVSLVDSPLHRIWGDDMSEKVAIITPYMHQKQLYDVKLQELREKKGWSTSAMPQVLTVKEAAGRDFDHAILDLVDCNVKGDAEQFQRDELGCEIFFTRGRKAMWIIGGDNPEGAAAAS